MYLGLQVYEYICVYILYKAALSGLSLEASVVTFYIYFYISLRVTVFVRLVLLLFLLLSFWVAGSFFLLGGVATGVSASPNIFGVLSLVSLVHSLIRFGSHRFSKCPPHRTSCTLHWGYSAVCCTCAAQLHQLKVNPHPLRSHHPRRHSYDCCCARSVAARPHCD